MFGELDVNLFSIPLRRAAARGGTLNVIGPRDGKVYYLRILARNDAIFAISGHFDL